MKYIIYIVLLFFLSCSDNGGVYEKVYDKSFNGVDDKTITLSGDNYYLLDKVQRAFKKEGVKIAQNQPIKVVLNSHYVISCKNPVVHAVGADFSGYIRLSVFKEGKEIYRIQKDFRSKVTQNMVDKIVKKVVSR